MKRSFSQVGGDKGSSAPLNTPSVVRAFSVDSVVASSVSNLQQRQFFSLLFLQRYFQSDASGDPTLMLLTRQNKELFLELKRRKRSISELRRQLQHQRQENALAEDLLSVLDRNYNQVSGTVITYSFNVCLLMVMLLLYTV